MSRIHETFQQLKTKRQKALVGFVTAGNPDINCSLEIVLAMCEGGVDILELGLPFTDPAADGPVIQRASQRSLASGTTIETVLELTERLRTHTFAPVIYMGYYNPVYAFGVERFYNAAVAAGADGILMVDLPPEESDEMTEKWPGNALSLIRMVAPTTTPQRMSRIAEKASGFLYLVSKTGITGSDGLNVASVEENLAVLRSITELPVCVGFGISRPEQVAAVAAVADGVVIGTAFEKVIEDNISRPELARLVGQKAAEFKAATHL